MEQVNFVCKARYFTTMEKLINTEVDVELLEKGSFTSTKLESSFFMFFYVK